MAVYQPKYPPYAHQLEALAKMKGKRAFALLMAMRTGKTKVVLDDFGQLELDGEVQDLLVIGPKGALPPWVQAIEEHCSDDLQSRLMVLFWQSVGNAAYNQALRTFLSNPKGLRRIFLVNIEALSTAGGARKAVATFTKLRQVMGAIDEATVIKSHKAARTKYVTREVTPMFKYRRILSGLIAPKGPLDLYTPFEFLDHRILNCASFYAFRGRYATLQTTYLGGRSIQTVAGYKNIDELQRLIEPYSYRVQLKDVYDMPESIWIRREIALTPEQSRVYSELRDYATAKLSATEHVTATVVIAQIIRLQQVLLGHVVDEEGKLHYLPETRTEALLSILEETEGKAIIWAPFTETIRLIKETLIAHYGPECVAEFSGKNSATREVEEALFKTHPACRFMVATAAAGGRGRTWDMADLVIYFGNSYDLEHREQSEERPKKVGKNIPIAYIDLVAPNTVDEVILKVLRNKINVSAAIQGDGWREWII